MKRKGLLAAALVCLASTGAAADTNAGIEQVVVTATRVPEPVGRVPADISVVAASDMQARDAWNLATALALVPGVEAPAGGDAGPSSAVPSFWGLHEFDAFLLVVDEVPWGGAFNPAISTLDLNDVERVEVMKGSAPVMYGATSFVGVVQVLHYPAGQAASEADIAGGNYGSARGSASFVLPQFDNYRQSLAVDGQSIGFADKRENVSTGQLLYRGALDVAGGTLGIDADVTINRDAPASPIIRQGAGLTNLIPIDANFNPANAAIDENKYHTALSWSEPTAWGQWDSTVSMAHSDIVDIRAFLHRDLSGAADTQDQRRLINDDYFDTHLTDKLGEDTTLVFGADLLNGLGRQTTLNGNSAYTVPLNGSVLPPPTTALPVNEVGTVDDQRVFAGQYAQLDWEPDARWDVVAGLRLNETYEHKHTTDLLLPPPQLAAGSSNRTLIRPAETVGASYRAWEDGSNELVLYADFRDAFKPAAIDFGPDFQPKVLLPETTQTYEAGLKGALLGGALNWQTELFWQDFQNLVVATPSGFLTNAASDRLKGAEFETRFQLAPDLALAASFAYHDARFGQYLFFNGVTSVNVAGKQLTLSPHILASGGLVYTPEQGLNATVVASYVGRRYLDEENTAPVSGYTTLDATLGYRFDRYRVSLEGANLTNRRPPVTASEFGSQSFYLLPARTLWLRLGTAL